MHMAQIAQRAHLKRRVGQQPLDRIPVYAADRQLHIRLLAVQELLCSGAQEVSEERPERRSRRSLCCRLHAWCLSIMQGLGCA